MTSTIRKEGMSTPRAVIPGRVYMLTRRCSERRFFLRPNEETNNAFIYCLALASQKYDVDVIFTAAMSNHHHTGVLDKHGRLPDFLAHFHKLLAKHQNSLLGRWEAFWAPEQTSAVHLSDIDDVLCRMAYALGNPAKDHLVEKVDQWPGVNSLRAILDDVPMTATKPRRFFRADGTLPDSVSLKLARPPQLQHLSQADLVAALKERITAIESKAADERAVSGKGIVGRDHLTRQNWQDSPRSEDRRRSERDGRQASKNGWRRAEIVLRSKAWLAAYKKARDEFLSGTATIFPAGTFWLQRYAGVICETFSTA